MTNYFPIIRREQENKMSEAIEGGASVDISADPISQEIGSGDIEASAQEDSGLQQPVDGVEADQLAEDLEAAVEDGASDAEIQELIKSYKIKVNGQEKEVELDFSNEADIIRRLQMAEAGQSAMQRASEVERNFDDFLSDVQTNPLDFLKELGINPAEFAEGILEKEIEHLKKTPEQLAQEQRDSELEELRQKLKSQEQEKADWEFQQMQKEAEQDFENQIIEALSSTSELPKTPYVTKRIADAMLVAMSNGHDVTAKDVLPWVENEINEEIKGLFTGMEDKALQKYLGKGVSDRLRKQRLENMPKSSKVQDTGKSNSQETAEQARVKVNDWLKGRSSL
jgi:hypothetical protein